MSVLPGIDRQSATPYYQQLVTVLERQIAQGEVAVGDQLPGESELSREYGLSRATVRQALQTLESRGLAHRVAGRGVFVSDRFESRGWVIQGREGFFENAIGYQNRAVTTKVLRYGNVPLPQYASRGLDLADGAQGFELVRLRRLDGTPALYSVNYSPPPVAAIVAGAKDVLAGAASLSEVLAAAGYSMGGAQRTVRALTPSPDIAQELEVGPTTPLVHIRSVSWTADGRRYDMYDTWVRTDVTPLEVNVSVSTQL